MADVSDLASLMQVIQGVQGTSSTQSTSGGTATQKQTQKQDVSDEGIQELLQQILAGPGGVRSIGSSARTAGVYDSTTEDLLMGNLYARAANQAELARTPTVSETQTTTPEQVVTLEQPGVGMGGLLTTLAGTSAMGSLTNPDGILANAIKGVGGKAMDGISGLFGGGAEAATAAGSSAGTNFMSQVATNAPASTAASAGTNFMTEAVTGNVASSAASNAATASMGSRAGNFLSTNALPMGGSFLSGVLGGKDSAKDPTSMALNAAMGFATMGPLGLAAGPITAARGGILSDPIKDAASDVAGVGRSIGREAERGIESVGKEVKRFGRKIGKVFGW